MSAGRVVVAGGGLAGLVVAHRLARELPAASVVVLEQAPSCGGLLRTERTGGFVLEAGPDSFLTAKPHALALCESLGISGELMSTSAHAPRAFIRRDDRFLPIPEGLSGLVPVRLSALFGSGVLSLAGCARFALDLVLPPGAPIEDEGIGAFVRRRFGHEAWTDLFEPLLSGIHGGDAEHLSVRATFPALVEAEARAGSVLAGMREAARARPVAPRAWTPFVAPRTGMARLIEALRAHVGEADVRTSRAVTAVRPVTDPDADAGAGTAGSVPDRNAWSVVLADGETLAADAVVLALPAHAAAGVVRGMAPDLAAELDAIRCAPATVVHLAWARADCPHPLAGHGYLNPRAGGRPVAACTWSSSKFAQRAPAETVLLRMFLRAADADSAGPGEAEAVRLAREEARAALGIRASPLLQRVVHWPAALPRYAVGHPRRLEAIARLLADRPGLFLTGNAYRGVGIPDTIHDATVTATRVREYLTGAA